MSPRRSATRPAARRGTPGPGAGDPPGNPPGRARWIVLLLLVATAIAYEPVRSNGFIHYDDGVYITENPRVQQGFTADALAFAFNVGYAGNWHPLTWLSHVLDFALYGFDPVGHHLTNVLLHAASAVVLFFALRRWTGREGASAFVAAAFALHPLHVESVAWAAERKDVLSTFLGLLSLRAWIEWKLAGRRSLYAAALALFVIGLTAKPMLVSFPVLLVLLDLFPLGPRGSRTERPRSGGGNRVRDLVLEKLPFFLLAASSCCLTFAAQKRGGAVAGTDALPMAIRFGNAITSYAAYLGKALVPTDLSIFYPFPDDGIAAWKIALSLVIVGGVSVLALLCARSRPWLGLGWFWYLATLLPVIGIVQVGQQAMADRYTYVPLVGISIVAAFEVTRLLPRGPSLVLGLACAAVWLGVTRHQVSLWKDDQTLFAHAVLATERNYMARYRLGFALAELDQYDEALAEYRAALAIRPSFADPHNNIGMIEAKLGRPAEALASYDRALALDPKLAPAHGNRANALDDLGRFEEAERAYRESIRLDPELPEVHNDYGVALAQQGRLDEAVREMREAIRLRPGYGDAYLNLARALHQLGRREEAIESLREGVRLNPNRADAKATLDELTRLQAAPGG